MHLEREINSWNTVKISDNAQERQLITKPNKVNEEVCDFWK